jgi:hypothetical protein
MMTGPVGCWPRPVLSSKPSLDRVVVVRLDVVRNAGSDDFAFAQAHFAKRLCLQLTPCSAMPERFVVKLEQIPIIWTRSRHV